MTLRDDWKEKCEELGISNEGADLLWDFIEDRVGATQEKLMTDLSNERSIRVGLEKKLEALANELAKLQSN